MSGAVSIPLAFLALLVGGKPSVWLAILGYVALWIAVIKMAGDKYKTQNKKAVAAILSSYFRALDTTLELLKRCRIANEVEEAGDVVLNGLETCDEIREFIAESIGTTEATIFAAKNDQTGRISGTTKPDFFELSIGLLTYKLLKLKEIMERYS